MGAGGWLLEGWLPVAYWRLNLSRRYRDAACSSHVTCHCFSPFLSTNHYPLFFHLRTPGCFSAFQPTPPGPGFLEGM
jgi:hypothetical protein